VDVATVLTDNLGATLVHITGTRALLFFFLYLYLLSGTVLTDNLGATLVHIAGLRFFFSRISFFFLYLYFVSLFLYIFFLNYHNYPPHTHYLSYLDLSCGVSVVLREIRGQRVPYPETKLNLISLSN
jgi:hypothetical protein